MIFFLLLIFSISLRIFEYKVEDILHVEYLEKEPETHLEVIETAKTKHKFTLGVFYQTQKPTYHIELFGDHNPITNRLSKDTRIDKIRKIFVSK